MMEQLLLHLIGDYVTQSDWMALNKRSISAIALLHAAIYSVPFLLFAHASPTAYNVIMWTHFLIDRFGLARYLVFAKNFLGWPWPKWADCRATGYPSDRPAWMAVWLLIIADNTLHLTINYAALRWL